MDFEALKLNVLNFFSTNLKTYIDEVNSRKTDLVLQYPDKYIRGYPNPVLQTAKVNFYVFESEHQLAPYSNECNILKNDITLYTTIRGYDDATLDKYEERYKEAVYNLIDAQDSMGGLFSSAYLTSIKSYYGYEQINNIVCIEYKLSTIKYIYN